jgi:hypothetical protein
MGEAARAAAGQAHQPRPRGRHLDEHAAPRMERCQQRPGGQRSVGRHHAYLRRFIAFWQEQLAGAENGLFAGERGRRRPLGTRCRPSWRSPQPPAKWLYDGERRAIMDELGAAATVYRETCIYESGSPDSKSPSGQAVDDFLALAQVISNKPCGPTGGPRRPLSRYNILRLGPEKRRRTPLSHARRAGRHPLVGPAGPDEALALLQNLRRSDLYRADQHSYMLYPHRDLPGFRQKNNVPAEKVAGSPLVAALAGAATPASWRWMTSVSITSTAASATPTMSPRPRRAGPGAGLCRSGAAERAFILELFEETFNHRAFTGRSGTFFAYEGLGSIYWHMVSKLLLAAQECYQSAGQLGREPGGHRGAGRRPTTTFAPGWASTSRPIRVRRLSHRPLLPYTLGQWGAPAGNDRPGEGGNPGSLGRVRRKGSNRADPF